MPEKHTAGEMHGCIVCGKLYELYVVYDANGKFVDCRVMTSGGTRVASADRPLVACDTHTDGQIRAAVRRVYGDQAEDSD